MAKSVTQIEIEKIDAEIAVLQATRARLLAMQQAQPKRKTRAKGLTPAQSAGFEKRERA